MSNNTNEKSYYILSINLTKLQSNSPNTICINGDDVDVNYYINNNTIQYCDVRNILDYVNINDLYFTLNKTNKQETNIKVLTYIKNCFLNGLNNNRVQESTNHIKIVQQNTADFEQPLALYGRGEWEFAHETKDWEFGKDVYIIEDNMEEPIQSLMDSTKSARAFVSNVDGIDYNGVHYPYMTQFDLECRIVGVQEEGFEVFFKDGVTRVNIPYYTDEFGNLRYYLNKRYYTKEEIISMGYTEQPS